jgi:exodeoxyribonuclease V gamma subunit
MLHVHRAERADCLIGALGELLADPLPDPFAAEVIAVPTHGMERWLTQRLSAHLGTSAGRADGVCANVAFPSPGRVVADALAAAGGDDPETDPWVPYRALWALLETIDACVEERPGWAEPLVRHLAAGQDDRSRRLSTARHLAGLFRRYELERPDMVLVWADGGDEAGGGPALDPVAAWQPQLWRGLRARIGRPGLAERLGPACGRLRAEPTLSSLPSRISCFGLTRLPVAQLEVLRALADGGRDVHLWLLHPSPASWHATAQLAEHSGVRRRRDALALPLPANSLMASWGRDVRELQLVLAGARPFGDTHHPMAGATSTLLARLQDDVRADRSPPGPPPGAAADLRLELDPGDRSVQVHACHGRARQVEVLRDAILHALADDPSLEPRDVIVMCPDIETFAPLVQATFGAGEDLADGHAFELPDDLHPAEPPSIDLRVRLADRSQRQTNAVLGVVSRLLELADERLTASQVLDLVDREPIRRRFGFDDDDLARLEEWVAASGARWGLDAEHRRAFGLDHVADGTWRTGLDRLAVGVAVAEDGPRLVGGVLPLDDVDSSSIELAGRFAELLDRLGTALRALAGPQPLPAWSASLAAAADALTATTTGDAWQRSVLQRILADLCDDAATVGATTETVGLTLADVRSLLSERLQGRPTRANFRTGHLTVCTLSPMRSVPHRVVCLLGLDDTYFPRRGSRDGDDVLLDDPHVGDHDAPAEDRQILLDALLAATDRLIVTYTGRDERTNAARPPAVPVSELLDVIDRTARIADAGAAAAASVRAARDAVVVHHPLQPFDARNFIPGALVSGGPWSYDPTARDGARALAGERRPPSAFLAAPLEPVNAPVIELDDLVAFAGHPVRAFVEQRLGIRATGRAAEIHDTLPIELDPLARWAVGDRLLAARLAGADLSDAVAGERARGTLPPGRIGAGAIERLTPLVEAVVTAAAQAGVRSDSDTVDIRLELPGDRLLTGTVAGVAGDHLQAVAFSRVSAAHRLAAWVRLLALTAADPERPFAAVTVGRARGGASGQNATATVAQLPVIGRGDASPDERRTIALGHLAGLVELFDLGLVEPLPVFSETSAAYAAGGLDPQARAAERWQQDWSHGIRVAGENEREEHVRVLGGVLPFAALLTDPPRDRETGEGWDETEPTRFGRYARRWWLDLLAHERLADR